MEAGLGIAHFDVLGELGSGAMGIVYRAHDTVLDRDVALKLVHPDRADPDVRRRFLEEARIAATLSHSGIAAIYQAGEAAISDNTAPQLYVAQELVEGETLRNLLKRGALPIDRAIDLVGQLLEALGEAHARGVIHRDINPANLMVTHSGRLKVLDFGIARRLIAPAATTRLSDDPPQGARAAGNTVVGTPGYMAPRATARDCRRPLGPVRCRVCAVRVADGSATVSVPDRADRSGALRGAAHAAP